MPVAKRPPPRPARSGQHPFDARLVDANLFGWFMPIIEVFQRQFVILLVGGLVALALQFLLPYIAFSSPLFETRAWPRIADWLVALALTSGLFAGAYALLAHNEGRAHGLGATESGGSIFAKATGLALIWTGVGLGIAIALMVVGYAVFKAFGSGIGGEVGIAALMLLGTVVAIGAAVVFLLFAPFWVGLAIRYSLSFARIVRTEEGPWTAFRLAWQRVSAESWRYFWPAYVVVLLLLGVAFLLAFQQALFGTTEVLSHLVAVVGFGFSLALAFVIERVYDTALGLEPDVDPTSADEPDATPPADAPAGAVVAAAAAASGSATAAPAATQANTASSANAPGPPINAEQFAALLDQHTYSARELRGLLARCTSPAAGLAAARAQFLAMAQGARLAEAVILVEAALAGDGRFFVGVPDMVPPLAKRVASGGRPDLAVKMLQPFVKEQREHKLHLTAALFAAHLVAQNLKKPDAAKQFLLQLKQLYPHEQLIDQQLKRLAS
jgi:hypothetical protein